MLVTLLLQKCNYKPYLFKNETVLPNTIFKHICLKDIYNKLSLLCYLFKITSRHNYLSQ